MSAKKNDKRDRKPAMQYVHPDFWLGVGRAMLAGELKYGGWNFLKGHGKLQLCASILRHTACIMKGEDIDEDTSELLGQTVLHRDCIGACLNMMTWQEEHGTMIDDRPTKEEKTNGLSIQSTTQDEGSATADTGRYEANTGYIVRSSY